MASSDIYGVKESLGAKKEDGSPTSQRRRHRHSPETFDEVMNKDVSKTNRRRRHNSGLRRFQHLMRKPEFSKKFWTITLSVGGLILLVLLVWDLFFRYPNEKIDYSPNSYRTVVK